MPRRRATPSRSARRQARVRKALELAAAGRRVALVSSGDAGIYGMAALACELLETSADPAWQRVALTVSPGVSALQAAAARAGAPLGHDFCAISLSDLLTPWPAIERRLQAAAAADFVTVLYNPAARRRRAGLERALAILGAARPPATPVVHARNLGRAGEAVEIAPLAEFAPATVDMLSLLIVGSSHTRRLRRPARRARLHPARLRARRRRVMTVHFIGAGPGAPDLITLRGLRLIRRCPVVLYAGSLVPAEVVAEAGADAPVPPRVIDTAALDLDAIIGRDRGRRIARATTSRGCIRATRRSTARSPSRCAASGRSGSTTR